MARSYKIYIWKTAPFLRLLIPLSAGILIQYYFKLPLDKIIIPGCILILLTIIFRFLPLSYRFKFRGAQGVFISLFILFLAMFLTRQKDIRNENAWYGNYYDSSCYIVATLSEPPVEKAKSYKVLATAESIVRNDSIYSAKGSILLYFSKDSSGQVPKFGDKLIISKALQRIRNSGNPGAFDYARYSAFHQLFHQVYLKKTDWVLMEHKEPTDYNSYIFSARQRIISILDKYIPGNDEKAIAIALLIGYKVDLDKDLVQAYSNAGVVHLIAISGMHMAIIY
ncbi:MAG: ComEC/Rec2 family competence protein, partial [Ginsengibacter sp.]